MSPSTGGEIGTYSLMSYHLRNTGAPEQRQTQDVVGPTHRVAARISFEPEFVARLEEQLGRPLSPRQSRRTPYLLAQSRHEKPPRAISLRPRSFPKFPEVSVPKFHPRRRRAGCFFVIREPLVRGGLRETSMTWKARVQKGQRFLRYICSMIRRSFGLFTWDRAAIRHTNADGAMHATTPRRSGRR